jgi:predicted RNase H-like HicB family nuclease
LAEQRPRAGPAVWQRFAGPPSHFTVCVLEPAFYNRRLEVSMKYRIALHKSDEGYSVSVPGLPGCWSQGTTEQEAVENIRDAIREYLSVVEEQLRGEEVREVEVTV